MIHPAFSRPNPPPPPKSDPPPPPPNPTPTHICMLKLLAPCALCYVCLYLSAATCLSAAVHICVCLQVLTIKQIATLHVRSYPYFADTDCLLEALTREHGESSQQQVLAAAHTVDTKNHWVKMRTYHANLTDDTQHVYVPFKDSADSDHRSGSEGTSALTHVEQDTATWFLNVKH